MAVGPFYQRKSAIAHQRREREYANAKNAEFTKEIRRKAWEEEWRPIINAIGEISVQEAMDAIERTL